MLRVLRFGFRGHRNGDDIRLVVITGEESAIVDLFQLHAVVVDHTIGRDRAAAVFDEPPYGFLSIQFVQFIHACTAAVQVHVMVAADGGEVGKVCNDRGLLAAEGQVDEIHTGGTDACGHSSGSIRTPHLWTCNEMGCGISHRLWVFDRAETSSTAPTPAAACLA